MRDGAGTSAFFPNRIDGKLDDGLVADRIQIRPKQSGDGPSNEEDRVLEQKADRPRLLAVR